MASHAILSAVTTVNSVTVPHSQWLDTVLADTTLAARRARVRHLTVRQGAYDLDQQQEFNLSVLAQAFPSVTQLDGVDVRAENIQALRSFDALQRLVLHAHDLQVLVSISAADFPSLELLTTHSCQLKVHGAMVNLRSLELSDFFNGTMQDISMLKCCPKLSELSLKRQRVPLSAIADLMEIAPRLTRFQCGTVDSIWSTDNPNIRADEALAERLARAFKRLETLIINYGCFQDLSSFSHITTLLRLDVAFVYTDDLRPLKKLVNLEALQLWSHRPVDLATLAALPRLKSLTYSTSREFQEQSQHTISFSSLQSVFFATYNSHQALNLPLISAPRLYKLELDMCKCGEMNDLHLRFPHLRDLTISNLDWSPEACHLDAGRSVLMSIARLQLLESLRLDCFPPGFEWEYLASLPKLRKLVLRGDRFKTLHGIDKVPSLVDFHFWLEVCPVAIDLSPLEALPRLQELRVYSDVVSVVPLTRKPRLQVVRLSRHVDCRPLIIAYHANRLRPPGTLSSLDLKKVYRNGTNCLWSNLELVNAHPTEAANTGSSH